MPYLALLFGVLFGAFLNNCIYRIPRNESITLPVTFRGGSLKLKKEDLQYPLVQIITGITFYLIVKNYNLSWTAISYLVLACLAIVAAFIDLSWQIIPNKLIAFGFGSGVLLNILFRPIPLMSALLGFLAGGVVILTIFILSRGGLGGGDVKYLAMIGLYVGWPGNLLVLFIAYMLGALVSLFLLLTGVRNLKDTVPFGPFISIGALITVLWGPQLIHWYLIEFIT